MEVRELMDNIHGELLSKESDSASDMRME